MAITNEKKLPNVYGAPQTERKSVDQLRRSDPGKAEEQLQKSKDFAIKMMLADAKNSDPFDEEGGSNKSSQMLQTANLIAQLDSAMVQVQKMDQMVEAVKNPGYNALELQGKEISYDNSQKAFDGKSAVKFDYNLSHADEHKDSALTTTIEVKDQAGKVVYTTKGGDKAGDHTFVWDGRDSAGNKLLAGTYSIEVKSKGQKTVSGKQISFEVRASSTITAKVKSVEVQNGIVTKLVLDNGNVINKDQVKSIQDVKESKSAIALSPELIAKHVELDLGRVQVSGGDMDVYFNNHVVNPGKTTVRVYDDKGKLVKTLESNDIKEAGTDKITFAKTGLENGNYTVKVTVEDKDDSEEAAKELNNIMNTTVLGINYVNQTFITIDEVEFKAHNINAIVAQHTLSISERSAAYPGSKVEYSAAEFTFSPNEFGPDVIAKHPEEAGAIISHELLRIYNQAGELIAELKSEYNPYDQLDETSKRQIPLGMALRIRTKYAGQEDKKFDDIRSIEEKLADGTYKFAGNLAALFKKGDRKLNFAKWDGAFGAMAPQNLHGQSANEGDIFTYEHSTQYLKQDDTSFFGPSVIDKNIATVDSVDQYDNKLFLNLNNGQIIGEEQVLRWNK